MYSDDVNAVSSWLSNWHHSLFPPTALFSSWYTDGKNSSKNTSIDVTPPNIERPPVAATRQVMTTKAVTLPL
ncbi:hypothetical protein ACMD2_02324 [Ananas comosus]|uniref:Uncharacterized protein n=1 Tax=Ananas comosus TaxID=4615 RepID=A0A199VC42_ANACO|nr:hypothetical protein ACMD2_02324 [Ananas comosus]